jgi:hypothetical protein
VITYQPSPHFKDRLKDFDDYIVVKWVEHTETLEIWSALPNKSPVLEHSYCRNNRVRVKPLFNWDMEWIVLGQLERARRWQHMSVVDFQNDMLDKQAKFRAQGEAEAEEKFEGFMSDPYWHKKRLQENENNDFGKCTTQWAGATNPEGNKKNDENMES